MPKPTGGFPPRPADSLLAIVQLYWRPAYRFRMVGGAERAKVIV